MSGLIAPSAQPIQARRYRFSRINHQRRYHHWTYRKHVNYRISRSRFHIRRWTTHIATAVNSSASAKTSSLARLNYEGSPILILDHDQPQFSRQTLSLHHGAWQHYGQLDHENRVTAANAMLNKRLMPRREREPLHVDPTGWHNKRISCGWLFNRSHLIGYQFTGKNNNLRNLMTGTRQLNDPDMSQYENQVAYYLRDTSNHYVRYRITPIFRANELLARGVHMEAESIGDNSIRLNVYIFNVEPGVTLNYKNGNSTVH